MGNIPPMYSSSCYGWIYPKLPSRYGPSQCLGTREENRPPIAPIQLAFEIEEIARNMNLSERLRMLAAISALINLASLRLSGLREGLGYGATDTAACGRAINHRDMNGALMAWGTPLVGRPAR